MPATTIRIRRNLDMFVWSNKTMLILVAAGNEGIDANSDGVVDRIRWIRRGRRRTA